MPPKQRMPPQVKYIVGNEACERFSYYGMSTIVVPFLTDHLHIAENLATYRYHLFVAGAYFMPLIGALLADRFFGRFKIILTLSVAYVIGHAWIAAQPTLDGLTIGMIFIAIGAGGIKPNVSAFAGDQFDEKQTTLIERMYGYFYMSINIGSFVSIYLTPWLLTKYGPDVAFGVPGVLMAMALLIFWLGRKTYRRAPPSGPNPNGFFRVLAYALKYRKPGQPLLDAARGHFPDEAVDGVSAVWGITKVFAMCIIWWGLWNQQSSTWTLQAEHMDLTVFGFTFEAAQIQDLNSVLVILSIPLLSWGPYRWADRAGIKPTPVRRMKVGMFLMVLAFVAAALVETAIAGGARPNVLWQVWQYTFLSVSEVLISATALEFAYKQAPKSMKSIIMGIWFLTISLGNLMTAYIAKLNTFSGPTFYWFFAGLMLLASFAFLAITSGFREKDLELQASPS
jgi:POT family proton-dependent oligopeptide transporter